MVRKRCPAVTELFNVMFRDRSAGDAGKGQVNWPAHGCFGLLLGRLQAMQAMKVLSLVEELLLLGYRVSSRGNRG
jgi:hypothetical protein